MRASELPRNKKRLMFALDITWFIFVVCDLFWWHTGGVVAWIATGISSIINIVVGWPHRRGRKARRPGD